MSLLADITRCWDAGCPERTACRRWLERDSGTVHALSLFPYDEDIGSRCSLRIPITTETMSNNDHPITPPPELVEQWLTEGHHQDYCSATEHAIAQAARWGADQELEACCKLLDSAAIVPIDKGKTLPENRLAARERISKLRAARRPKHPNLKAQALAALSRADKDALTNPLTGEVVALRTILRKEQADTIRRALEALDD